MTTGNHITDVTIGVIPLDSPAELYTGEAEGDRSVNFRDYSFIASRWLEKVLWP